MADTIKKGDFIEINFTGKEKDTGEIFVGGNRGLDIRTTSAHNITLAPGHSASLTLRRGSVTVSTQFNNYSDAKLKDEQQEVDLEERGTVLDSVRPKTYVRNMSENKEKSSGFLAQDIKQAASTLNPEKQLNE